MKRKKFAETQIIAILKAAEAGARPDDLAREHGMSVGTFYVWKAKFGGMSVNDAQRLRAFEEQNRQLKRLVADQALDNQMLRFVVEKKLNVDERRGDVDLLVKDFSVSERRACRVLAQPRRTQRYATRGGDVLALRLQIRNLAYSAPRNGYRRI